MTSARGISFDLRASPTLTALLLAVAGLGAAAPLLTSLPWFVRWLLSAAIGVFGTYRTCVFRRPVVRRVALEADGVWTVTDHHGRIFPAELTASRVLGRAVFLSFRWRRGAGHVALLPDNTELDDLRMLRARLGRPGPVA